MNLEREIESVAILIRAPIAFREKACAVAKRIGRKRIRELKEFFHEPSEPRPAGFSVEECGLGGWLSFWQFAIFEILYNFKEESIPLLRDVAFGGYDWTQGNAIEILCRLAAEGFERERTLNDLAAAMPDIRYEALLYAAGPLLSQSKSNREIGTILDTLRRVPVFAEALEEVAPSVNHRKHDRADQQHHDGDGHP